MKKPIIYFFFILTTGALFLGGCKKDSSSSTPSAADELTLQTKVTNNSTDQLKVQGDEDNFSNDASLAIDTIKGFGFRKQKNVCSLDSSSIPDATIDRSMALTHKTVVVHYWGKNLYAYTRRGTLTVTLINGNKWSDAGAVLKETFDSCTVTYPNLGTLVYNGTRYVTNVNGGLIYALSPDTVVYKIRVTGTVTYPNGTSGSWNGFHKNTYIKSSQTFSTIGDTTINGEICSLTGQTRYGKDYVVESPTAIVVTKNCGLAYPSSGVRTIISDGNSTTITYGVDAIGNPITTGCASYFKISWTKLSGASGSVVIPY